MLEVMKAVRDDLPLLQVQVVQQQSNQTGPDLILLLRIFHDAEEFPDQLRHLVSPKCPGSASGRRPGDILTRWSSSVLLHVEEQRLNSESLLEDWSFIWVRVQPPTIAIHFSCWNPQMTGPGPVVQVQSPNEGVDLVHCYMPRTELPSSFWIWGFSINWTLFSSTPAGTSPGRSGISL